MMRGSISPLKMMVSCPLRDAEAAGATPGAVRVSNPSSQTPVFSECLHISAALPAAQKDASEA